MDESLRRRILEELSAEAPEAQVMRPWQFTVMDFAQMMGWQRAKAERWLRREVALKRMRMELRGYDPRTGRNAALYWRPEDEPAHED